MFCFRRGEEESIFGGIIEQIAQAVTVVLVREGSRLSVASA